MATNALTSLMGAAYVQLDWAKEPVYIGSCFDGDDLPDSQGDADPIMCYDAQGRWVVKGTTRTPPDKNTFGVTGLLDRAVTVLEPLKERQCPFNFYASLGECGTRGISPNNADKLYVYGPVWVTDNPIQQWMARMDDAETLANYAFSAMPGRIDLRTPVFTELTTDSDQDMLSLAVRDSRCASACGYQILPGDDAYFGATGAVAATPDVQRLQNGSTNPTDVANLPFLVDENCVSSVRFQVDADTERWLIAREAVAANPPEVAYTDDGGVTAWVTVVIGATANVGALGPQALFALDFNHIWYSAGSEMYFSSDGGLTWTLQLSPTAVEAIHFVDARNGFAVGLADEMYRTVDGGTTWETLAGTGGAADLLTLHVFSEQRIIVGTDDANFWYSWDSGDNWTELLDLAAAGEITRLHFWSDARGVAVYNTAAPVGTVYLTSDGGNSWTAQATPANLGLNDIEMYSNNGCYVAGNVGAGATAILLKGSG